jgi:hypothetical protein
MQFSMLLMELEDHTGAHAKLQKNNEPKDMQRQT